MKMVKIVLPSGADIFINVDSVCDVRKDPMTENHTLIQLPNNLHKVKLTVSEVLKLLGVKDVL